jgi:hypothetical protein
VPLSPASRQNGWGYSIWNFTTSPGSMCDCARSRADGSGGSYDTLVAIVGGSAMTTRVQVSVRRVVVTVTGVPSSALWCPQPSTRRTSSSRSTR